MKIGHQFQRSLTFRCFRQKVVTGEHDEILSAAAGLEVDVKGRNVISHPNQPEAGTCRSWRNATMTVMIENSEPIQRAR